MVITSITFATTNEAKIKQIRAALAPIGVTVQGMVDKTSLPSVEEDGDSAQGNARKKALVYAKALGETVLSMDNALYLDGLLPDKQPGCHIRRFPGSTGRPTDEEMLAYYATLIEKLGGRVAGYFEYGLCVAHPDGRYKETKFRCPRMFTIPASSTRMPGYPLESLQRDLETGKYVSEMSDEEQERWWQRSVGEVVQQFIRNVEM